MKKMQMIKNIYLDNDKETREIGFKLGKLLKPGSIVCLIGDLGAGKTTMTQSLALITVRMSCSILTGVDLNFLARCG